MDDDGPLLHLQEASAVRGLTAGNHATVWMPWRSTIQMMITGGMDLLSHAPSLLCTPMPRMQELWGERFMCVDTTKKQVRKNPLSTYTVMRQAERERTLVFDLVSQVVMTL